MAPNVVASQPARAASRAGWLIAAVGGFLISAALIAVVVVHFADKSSVTVGSPKVVVASASAIAAAPTQPVASATQAPTAAASPSVAASAASAVASATSPNPVNSASSAPSATTSATAAPTATATAAPQIPSQSAALVAGKEARQHRIFVDGKPIGEGPGTYFVSCGTHTVKIGSSGKPRDLDIACGTSINVP
jgi:hypothetical protein